MYPIKTNSQPRSFYTISTNMTNPSSLTSPHLERGRTYICKCTYNFQYPVPRYLDTAHHLYRSSFLSSISLYHPTSSKPPLNLHPPPPRMPPKPYAIIAGVGAGTGAAVAKRFAKAYSVVLLSRSTDSFSALEKEINDSGGHAVGIATDVVDENGVANALKIVDERFGRDAVCTVSTVPNLFFKLIHTSRFDPVVYIYICLSTLPCSVPFC